MATPDAELMKLALLSYEYPPETGFGGIGTYTWHHARTLVRLGHEVHVLAGATEPTSLRRHEHDGVTVFRYRASDKWLRWMKPLGYYRLWWTRNRIENAVSMYQAFKRLHREHRYDLAEMPECGAEGALINRMVDLKTVVKLHSPAQLIMPFYDVRQADITLCSAVERMGMRRATAVTSCSNYLAEEARNRIGVRQPIEVIPNGIDLSLFDAADQIDFRSKYDLPKDRPIIFFGGRMEHRKGIHLCRDIVADILSRHEAAFVFAGRDLFGYMENDMLPYLESRRLKGSVHYLHHLDRMDMHSGLCQSDIFLLPSLWENCPYACLEAMAAGRAVVASDQGGMPELIRHEENGLLARSGDMPSYVTQIERLLGDGGYRKQLGAAARETVTASFSDEAIANASIAFYNTVRQ